MRLALRSPLATLVPLLLLVPAAAITGGCSSGADVEDSGPTVIATGPKESTTAPTGRSTGEPTEKSTDETTEAETDATPSDPSSTPSELTDAVSAVCAPYVVMVRAIKNAGFSGADPDHVAAALAPVMKEFAAEVPDLERPPSMPPQVWRGIQVLATHILALPDRPTYTQVEAVEDELTDEERDAVEAAARCFRTTCPA